jgi:hypothetical protein
MTLNTAYAFALEIAGRIQWPLGVAGALAVAAAIDLITGFSLQIPDRVIAEVEAIHQIDELESQKKAASMEDYEHGKHKLLHVRTPFEARLINSRPQEAGARRVLTADFGAAARRAGPTAAEGSD